MRKFVIGAAASAAVLTGSIVAVAAINPLGVAGAQNGTPPTTAAPAPDPHAGNPGHGNHLGNGNGPQQVLDDTLNDLVSKGTINQDQANAVRDGLKSRIEAFRAQHGARGGPGHRGKGGPGFDLKTDVIDAAAQAIGITPDQLMQEHKAGKTLAQVAQAHGIDPQKVADAIVAKISADIDKAVADGKIPADRAAKMKAELTKRVPEMLNKNCFGDHHGDNGGPTPGTEPPPTTPPPTTPPTEPPPTEPPSTTPATTPTTTTPATQPPTTTAPGTTGPTTSGTQQH
jgi:polyhydroxyalkanoate synthesis regulator phasin